MVKQRQLAADFRPHEVLAALERHGVRYVLIGGMAAIARGTDQITFDLDVAHERSAENVERLVAALTELGAVRITFPDERTAPDVRNLDERVEQFVCPVGNIDVCNHAHRVGGYERRVEMADPVELVPGLTVLVATIDALIASKSGTGRSKDAVHVASLVRLKEEVARRRLDG